jgi:hypothetical protein
LISKLELLFCLLTFLLFCNSAPAAPLTQNALVGTYRVDASTVEGPGLPTNFYSVAVTLNADGSFVTTNAWVNFFFHYASHGRPKDVQRGTWKWTHKSDDQEDSLDLTFSTPSFDGSWSGPVTPYRGAPRIEFTYYPSKKDSAGFRFYLLKQR